MCVCKLHVCINYSHVYIQSIHLHVYTCVCVWLSLKNKLANPNQPLKKETVSIFKDLRNNHGKEEGVGASGLYA